MLNTEVLKLLEQYVVKERHPSMNDIGWQAPDDGRTIAPEAYLSPRLAVFGEGSDLRQRERFLEKLNAHISKLNGTADGPYLFYTGQAGGPHLFYTVETEGGCHLAVSASALAKKIETEGGGSISLLQPLQKKKL